MTWTWSEPLCLNMVYDSLNKQTNYAEAFMKKNEILVATTGIVVSLIVIFVIIVAMNGVAQHYWIESQ